VATVEISTPAAKGLVENHTQYGLWDITHAKKKIESTLRMVWNVP
jgi:hypothetical protein